MTKLSHVNKTGKVKMVDVSAKIVTHRTAKAYGELKVSPNILKLIHDNSLSKGDVISTAKIAGIQAAKKTSDLIPLCHNILINHIDIDITLNKKSSTVDILSTVVTDSKTGVEMEALTAVTVAALTIYDMTKGVDKSSVITNIKLISKSGGKSGKFNIVKS
jgi:molybdenum cofactor biosynthesis protein MoaC